MQPQLVTPARPTPREIKMLSDIDDQEGLMFQIPVIIACKNNPSMSNRKDPVPVIIREAISRALVYYYPLAGRLREGPNRKLMVDCNGEGVLFVEAKADVTLEQLGDAIRPPCPFLEGFLCDVPGSDGILGCPLLLFQDWPATSFPAGLKLWTENTMIDQGWPENLSPVSPERRKAVLEACAVVQEGEKPSPE
ncbi:hypothetical protein ACLB2K_021524 [Fragaria x ananassa]